jgi:hypothetical protein
MAQHKPGHAFLVVGGRDLSSDTFSLEETVEYAQTDLMGLHETWEARAPVGVAKTTLAAGGGYYDSATDRIVDALQEQGETQQLVSFGFADDVVGAGVTMLDGALAVKWKRMASREDLTKANGEYVVSGTNYRGRILHGLTAETAAGNTEATPIDTYADVLLPSVQILTSDGGSPVTVTTAVPHGLITGDVVVISGHEDGTTPPTSPLNAEFTVTVTSTTTFTVSVVATPGTGGVLKKVTSSGAIVDMHVPAISLGGYTNLAVLVRTKATGGAYSTVGTFATVTTVGAQRITISSATQVKRYVAISWTLTGSGSGPSFVPYVAISK